MSFRTHLHFVQAVLVNAMRLGLLMRIWTTTRELLVQLIVALFFSKTFYDLMSLLKWEGKYFTIIQGS